MKKNIFTVLIFSLIASIVQTLCISIMVRIKDVLASEEQVMVWGTKENFIVFGISVILVLLIGIILRKRDLDKITIFKSVTVLAVYMIVMIAIQNIYTRMTGNPITPAGIVEIWLSYPFYVYDSIRSAILSININMADFWVDRIAMILFPYILVLFGKRASVTKK